MIDQTRLNEVEKLTLSKGAHESLNQGLCIMEMVSYLANEPWSDHPQCSCVALTAYAISLNDRGDDEMRAKLKALAPRLIGTRDDHSKARANFLVLQLITTLLPILTDALELKEISEKLRRFKAGQWFEARDYINSVRPEIKAAARKHADADADADAAAYAAAYAYAAADADAAAAAAADAKNKKFWLDIRNKTFEAMFNSLEQAIDIKGE